MKIRWSQKPLTEVQAAAVLVPVLASKTDRGDAFRKADRATGGALAEVVDRERFGGKARQILVVHQPKGIKARKVILVGLGPADAVDVQTARRSFARVTSVLGPGRHTLATAVETENRDDAVVGAIEGLALATYSFDRHRKRAEAATEIGTLTVCGGRAAAGLRRRAEQALVLAAATHTARDLVNEPPGTMRPRDLARIARKIGRECGLKVKVLTRADIERRKMGGILGVAAGSDEDPRLIHLEYRPAKKAKKTIALVGKGITFDSGGSPSSPPRA